MIDLTDAATFDTPITVPEGTDTHDLAAENVQDIAQRLANRTAYLKLRADDAAQRGSDNVFTGSNEFTEVVTFDSDIEVVRDVLAGRDVSADHDITATRHVHAGNNVFAAGQFYYPAVKPRTSIVSLNTGVVFGVPAGLVLAHNPNAICASWIGGQYVAWRLLVPTDSVIRAVEIIHVTSTTAPNQFNLFKRSGAVYDLFGGGTVAPSVSSLTGGAVNGPSVAGTATTGVGPSSPIVVDNSVNEYWITWVSTGLHAADAVADIHVVWDDNGPRND